MADVDSLFSDYVAEHRSRGEADPRPYLEQLEGIDRDELATLIDGYLVRAPGRDWDPQAFEGSPESRWSEEMGRSLAGAAGAWPVLLPQLRERARIKRRDLVERLAAAIGAPAQTDKVAAYYHQMEQGQLAPEGVTTRVLEALAAIVGTSADALRAAGRALGTGEGPTEGVVFQRRAMPDPDYEREEAPAGAASPGRAEEADETGPDEVDRLFTGGD